VEGLPILYFYFHVEGMEMEGGVHGEQLDGGGHTHSTEQHLVGGEVGAYIPQISDFHSMDGFRHNPADSVLHLGFRLWVVVPEDKLMVQKEPVNGLRVADASGGG
jgi:hypothetical protein